MGCKNKINRYVPVLNLKHVFAQNAPTDVNTEKIETKALRFQYQIIQKTIIKVVI